MIAIEIPKNYALAPEWWKNLTSDLSPPTPISWPVYRMTVDNRLIKYGGRYRQQWIGAPILVTFREEEKYSSFLLRWC